MNHKRKEKNGEFWKGNVRRHNYANDGVSAWIGNFVAT